MVRGCAAFLFVLGLRGPMTIARQPQVYAKTKWAPRDVDIALQSADTGVLRDPADLCESIYSDQRARSAGDQRFLGLQGLELRFSGERRADLEHYFDQVFPTAELVKLHRWGTTLGVGLGQLVMPDAGARESATDLWMPRLLAWHPRTLTYQQTDDTWWTTTLQGERVKIDPTSGEWILYTPYGAVRPWAEGLWRALAFAWILKRLALHDRARHGEVNGTPIRKGTAPQGSSERARTDWRRALERLGRDSVVVLPPGYDLSLIETTGRGAELYAQQVEWADKAIAQLYLGQAVTVEGSNMGFGEGGVFRDVQRSLINFDAKTLREALGPYVDHWLDINFGEGDWQFSYATEPPVDQKLRAEALKELGTGVVSANAALVGSGKHIDAVRIFSEAGYPLLDGEPVLPAAPSPGVQPTQGAPSPG